MVVVPRRLFIRSCCAAAASAPFLDPRKAFAQGRKAPDGGSLQTPKKTISMEEFERYFELGKRKLPIADRSRIKEGDFTFRTDELKIDHQNPHIVVRSKDGTFCEVIGKKRNGAHRKKIDFGFIPPGNRGGKEGTLEFRIYRNGPGFERHRITHDESAGRHVHETVPIAELDSEYELAAQLRGKGIAVPRVWEGNPVEEKGWYARIYNYSGKAIGNGGAEFGGYTVEFVRKTDAVAFSFMDSGLNPPEAFWEFNGGVAPRIPGGVIRGEKGIRRYVMIGKTLEEVKEETGVWVAEARSLGAFSEKKCALVATENDLLVFHSSGAGYGMRIIRRERMPNGPGCEQVTINDAKTGEGREKLGYLIDGDTMRIAVAAKNAVPGCEVSLLSLSGNGKTSSEWAVLG